MKIMPIFLILAQIKFVYRFDSRKMKKKLDTTEYGSTE